MTRSPEGSPSRRPGRIVRVTKAGFNPPVLFAAPGELVRWVMEDQHTVHKLVCDAFAKEHTPKTQGQSISHAFDRVGEFVVSCAIPSAEPNCTVARASPSRAVVPYSKRALTSVTPKSQPERSYNARRGRVEGSF